MRSAPLLALGFLALAGTARAQTGISDSVPSPITRSALSAILAAKADVGGNITAQTVNLADVANFDTVHIDPNAGQFANLPALGAPCHQVGQVYVLSVACFGMQANSSAETYGYSFNLVNTDTGGTRPVSGQPGANNTDKVVLYIGGDEQTTHSNLWGLNMVLQDRAGMGGVAGAEWDMNRFDTCQMPTDLSWVGNSTCQQFVGQWITGVAAGGATGGPAVMITGVGSTPLWNDGVAILGKEVRDTGFYDSSNSTTAFKATGTHSSGLDLSGGSYTSAIRLTSGNTGEGVFWFPGANGGGTDSITDTGGGLVLASDTTHNVTLNGANVSVKAGSLVIQNATGTATNNAYINLNTDGSLHVGQFNVALGGLSVDGPITPGSVVIQNRAAPYANPGYITQIGDGSLRVAQQNVTTGGLTVDGAVKSASIQFTGHASGTGGTLPTVTGGTMVAGSSDTRGAVTLATGVTSATVTFASAFASAPFCVLTSKNPSENAAVTVGSTIAFAIGLAANASGETVNYLCMQ